VVNNKSFTLSLFKDNTVFWWSSCCLLLLVGIALWRYPQGSLLLYFSENRQAYTDLFFTYVTKIGEEPTYLLLTLGCLFIRFRYVFFIPLIGLVVTLVAFLAKSFFLHPRPSIYFRELGTLDTIQTVEGVQLLGGLTSFPSGHTMSAFALFSFLAFVYPKKGFYNLLFLGIAVLVGLSRIYLVQHFLKDVYLGAIMGVLIGGGMYLLQKRWLDNKEHWLNGRIGNDDYLQFQPQSQFQNLHESIEVDTLYFQ